MNDNLIRLEESLAGTDKCVMDIFALEEKLEDRMGIMQEELNAVKAENIEMRNHFNSMVKELNDIKRTELKKLLIMENEQTFEIDPPPNKGYNLRSYAVDEDSFDK